MSATIQPTKADKQSMKFLVSESPTSEDTWEIKNYLFHEIDLKYLIVKTQIEEKFILPVFFQMWLFHFISFVQGPFIILPILTLYYRHNLSILYNMQFIGKSSILATHIITVLMFLWFVVSLVGMITGPSSDKAGADKYNMTTLLFDGFHVITTFISRSSVIATKYAFLSKEVMDLYFS
jgi:hypothetical protein